tara:strand:+ start:5759 stop:6484 length:726 start_codon:yes stop_codon:yes gene_type:complete
MDMQSIVLVFSALLTSILSGVIGMGGGITLLAVMELFVPASALVPLHGSVQLMSNGTRVFLHFKHVKWSIGVPMLVGIVLGSIVAAQFTTTFQSTSEFKLVLAGFILAMTWKPKFKKGFKVVAKFYLVGFTSGILSMLLGATGPFLAPFFLNENLDRFQVISTKAFAQLTGHLSKVVAFFFLGFSFTQYGLIVLLMAGAVILGTYIGKRILQRVNEKTFIAVYKVVITTLCVRMIWMHFVN